MSDKYTPDGIVVGDTDPEFVRVKFADGIAVIGNGDPELFAPLSDGFAVGEENFSGGFAIVGEPGPEPYVLPPGSTIVPNAMNLHPNGPTTINFMVDGVQVGNTSFTVVNPFNSVCSGAEAIGLQHLTVSPVPPVYNLWEIVREVAKIDSTYEYAGAYFCPYCEARCANHLSDEELSKLFPHKEDCIVLKARAMVENK